MSKSFASRSKGGVHQPGEIVTGLYRPFDKNGPTVPRRVRETIRGVILRSHSPQHWVVHWFPISKSAYVPFNKIYAVRGADPLDSEHLRDLLRTEKDNYLGGTEELRNYVDTVYNGGDRKRPAVVLPPDNTGKGPPRKRTVRPTLPTRAGESTISTVLVSDVIMTKLTVFASCS